MLQLHAARAVPHFLRPIIISNDATHFIVYVLSISYSQIETKRMHTFSKRFCFLSCFFWLSAPTTYIVHTCCVCIYSKRNIISSTKSSQITRLRSSSKHFCLSFFQDKKTYLKLPALSCQAASAAFIFTALHLDRQDNHRSSWWRTAQLV